MDTSNKHAMKPLMTAAERKAAQAQAEIACSLDNPDACEMCSG